MPKTEVRIEVVKGVEGQCLLINDYRVAGPKPWGGGKVTAIFDVKKEDLEKALSE